MRLIAAGAVFLALASAAQAQQAAPLNLQAKIEQQLQLQIGQLVAANVVLRTQLEEAQASLAESQRQLAAERAKQEPAK